MPRRRIRYRSKEKKNQVDFLYREQSKSGFTAQIEYTPIGPTKITFTSKNERKSKLIKGIKAEILIVDYESEPVDEELP